MARKRKPLTKREYKAVKKIARRMISASIRRRRRRSRRSYR